jgi:hypothetical protein
VQWIARNDIILSVPFSTVVVTDSERLLPSSELQVEGHGLKPFKLAGVCLFKTFGNYIVVSVVRLHKS